MVKPSLITQLTRDRNKEHSLFSVLDPKDPYQKEAFRLSNNYKDYTFADELEFDSVKEEQEWLNERLYAERPGDLDRAKMENDRHIQNAYHPFTMMSYNRATGFG